jgi:hypothetical protein
MSPSVKLVTLNKVSPVEGSLYYWAAAYSPREYQAVMAARRPRQAPESELPFIHTGGAPS